MHKELGARFDEKVYCNAIELEFKARGIQYEREHPIHVMYRGEEVELYRLDFLVENAVIVEIKSVEAFAPIHMAQMISYLRATRFRLGILLNFNVKLLKDGIRRIAA